MTLVELEDGIKLLLRVAADWGMTEVPEDEDEYWTISSPDWLDFSEEPKPSVGSFFDDRAELEKLLREPARASSVDFQRAAHILMLVAERFMEPRGPAVERVEIRS